jgi:hypothetical protein
VVRLVLLIGKESKVLLLIPRGFAVVERELVCPSVGSAEFGFLEHYDRVSELLMGGGGKN